MQRTESTAKPNNHIMDELSIHLTNKEKVKHSYNCEYNNMSISSTTTTTKANAEPKRIKILSKSTLSRSQSRLQELGARERPHFRIDWRQLTYYQKPSSYLSQWFNGPKWSGNELINPDGVSGKMNSGEPKRILNSLDGCFRSGELSAILGPSGAGKSTFLSTLFGNKQEGAYGQTKVTWFNNCDENIADSLAVKRNKRRPIRIASLPQHDHLLHHLTVYETLIFASKIKNATRTVTGKNFHRQNVKRVAKMLKITDCLDTRCGKLSGGQYKRVSIGQELLSEPDVIILDEPTSGLDAMTCLTTVQTLKSIVTKHPMSIILTIHQPDIDVFYLFDHVYVIAQGGMAIYEGPPQDIMSTLAQVDLTSPSANYNPARFIVEQAFVVESGNEFSTTVNQQENNGGDSVETGSEDDDDEEEEDDDEKQTNGYIRRSVLSLTEAIGGKEMVSKKDKKPLLNIGIQTLDGKLITSEQLAKSKEIQQQTERWNLLKRLNQIQKARYKNQVDLLSLSTDPDGYSSGWQSPASGQLEPPINSNDTTVRSESSTGTLKDTSSSSSSSYGSSEEKHAKLSSTSAKSDYSSSGWSDRNKAPVDLEASSKIKSSTMSTKAISLADIPVPDQDHYHHLTLTAKNKSSHQGGSLQAVNSTINNKAASNHESASDHESILSEEVAGFVVNFSPVGDSSGRSSSDSDTTASISGEHKRLKRQFDKCLSAKHNCSRQKDYPIWYHGFLLTHRTWLSIIRDPIFFGIQACMHTIIPIILALIFGSSQEEGCPRVGNFDLVAFAYSDSDNLIQGTVSSIRQSIGNIGIVFFEMFVLSFSINCITALVFPLDMYVLLKEYRNGWYSLRSYFFGRTLADLPIPIVLHSIGMAILYFLTGQPHSWWRFCGIIALVILASLVAQSVGLTVGALLMKSSQSAVLAAAGIVAPFFALSGFIVRIHTLPFVAQLAAKGSYLYHLLNGFIILRYGFGRCECRLEDFEQNESHQIPSNLHTLASMWIGTYSDEYPNSRVMSGGSASNSSNRTNIDPNIDVVDKMMTAFKMANSYGHQIQDCDDVLPYAMLDFNLRDQDIYYCFLVIIAMLIISRSITFAAIYYKIRSFT